MNTLADRSSKVRSRTGALPDRPRQSRITCVKPGNPFPERQIVQISRVGIVYQRSDPMRDAPFERALQRIVIGLNVVNIGLTVEKVLVPNLPPLADAPEDWSSRCWPCLWCSPRPGYSPAFPECLCCEPT